MSHLHCEERGEEGGIEGLDGQKEGGYEETYQPHYMASQSADLIDTFF